MPTLIEDGLLRNKHLVFDDRADAGRHLGEKLAPLADSKAIVLAIPSGGIPVGKEIWKALSLDFDLLLVKKIQIPWNTEAGFGAVNIDGDIIMNEPLLASLRLTGEEIESQVRKTLAVLRMRDKAFRENRLFPSIESRQVIIVDDGLASGFTMRAAIKFVTKRAASEIILAVPTGSYDTVMNLARLVDTVVCLNIRDTYPYAVASAYRSWYDLSDEDVLRILEENRRRAESV